MSTREGRSTRRPIEDLADEVWVHRYAAAIAATPTVAIGLLMLGINVLTWLGAGVFYVATVVLAYFDSRMLQRLGFRVWWWLAIMPFPFIYLWHRTKRARGPVEILAIWAIAGLIVALFNQLNPKESSGETYQLDHTVVESKIEAQYARDGRYADLRCHFPMVGEIGDTFRCDANIGETWWEVRVTMQGNNRWKWSETG